MAKVKKVVAEEGLITVTRTYLNQVVETRKRIKIRPFATDTATVSAKFGATIKVGGPDSYEFARFDVMISMPAYVEEALDVYQEVRDMVEDLVDKEVAKVTDEVDGNGN